MLDIQPQAGCTREPGITPKLHLIIAKLHVHKKTLYTYVVFLCFSCLSAVLWNLAIPLYYFLERPPCDQQSFPMECFKLRSFENGRTVDGKKWGWWKKHYTRLSFQRFFMFTYLGKWSNLTNIFLCFGMVTRDFLLTPFVSSDSEGTEVARDRFVRFRCGVNNLTNIFQMAWNDQLVYNEWQKQ